MWRHRWLLHHGGPVDFTSVPLFARDVASPEGILFDLRSSSTGVAPTKSQEVPYPTLASPGLDHSFIVVFFNSGADAKEPVVGCADEVD